MTSWTVLDLLYTFRLLDWLTNFVALHLIFRLPMRQIFLLRDTQVVK